MQPPSTIDIKCPGFSLSQFYDLKMKLDKNQTQKVHPYFADRSNDSAHTSFDTLDLDSNDFTTDGVNP